jgi:class 3 adenylate cyclase/S1-C subfamily serine protease
MTACASCGHEAPDGAVTCPHCGADVTAPANPPRRTDERRTVTTLFCDLVGFTALSERNDAEAVDAFLHRYYAVARQAIESYGGTVEKYIGDAVVAVFGVPALHEDDPERAVRAGLRLVDEIDALPGIGGQAVEVRVGVNTGEALVRLDVDPASGEGFLTGDAVNVAARLQSAAPPMAVAVGEATHAATAQVFAYDACHPVALKGKSKPLQAWLATAPLARSGAELRSFSSAFVGREEELAALEALLAEAEDGRAVRLGLIVGEPGIGKSRLLAELARRLDDRPTLVTWRQGRCLPFGANVTFWALAEIVRSCAGILESDGVARAEARLEAALPEGPERDQTRARLRPLLGLEAEEASREENFAAWRAFLEALAADGPAIVVIEDLHWADEAMLAFMDYLTQSSADVPLLVLATARPEVLELTGPGAGFVAAAEHVALGPLSGDETAQLVLACLGAKSLPVSLQAKLLEASGGNPLFAEELVRLLQDRDLLEGRGGKVALREGAELPTPDSIGALIAARLDLLSAEHKGLLADAAVVGRTFWAGAAAAVGAREPAAVLDGLLELVAKELVRPERSSSIEGEREFLFVHALVCDVAYAQLTRADRAAKHAALARWLEERTAGRTEDLAEILAFHYGTALEMAGACGLFELEDELSEPTARYLALAGGRAAPLDAAAAAQHFARAERVADEAAKPKRRFFLSRRTRRTLRRRAPLLAAAAAVIAVAAVAALAIWAFAPEKTPNAGPKTMTPAQIADKYGSSVVRITTPLMPPSATGKKKPSRIVGSGFMATKDGLIVTSLAVVQGKGWNVPLTVAVEYTLPTGEYGKTTGEVLNHSEQIGIAEIKVDPQKVPLKPLLLGDSDSIAAGDPVVALAAQGGMSLQHANGVVLQTGYLTDTYTGNDHVYLLDDNLDFPSAVQSQPLAELGGPLFDKTGHVIAVVGPPGDMKGAWGYKGGVSQQALGIWWAIRDIKFAGVNKWDSQGFRSGKAYLGVSSEWLTPQVARGLGEPAAGALVVDAYVGSPAAKAGIQGMNSLKWFDDYTYGVGGDVIASVDGVRLTKDRQLGTVVGRHKPGDVIPVRLWRGGQLMTVRVKLAAAP